MRSEIRRVLTGIELKVALFIVLVMVVAQIYLINGVYEEFEVLKAEDSGSYLASLVPTTSFMQLWIGQDIYTGFRDLFYTVLFPAIAAMPYAASHFRDKRLGYDKLVISSIGKKRYFLCKYIIAFVSGGIVVSVPSVISLLWSMTKYPIVPVLENGQTSVVNGALWADIYMEKPLVYALLFISVGFVTGGCLSVVSLALTFYVKGIFQLLFIPMLLNLIIPGVLNPIPGAFGRLIYYIPYAYVDPMPGTRIKPEYIIISVIAMLIISALAYFINIRRDTI